MIITRTEMHDIVTDLALIRRRAAPATLRLLRHLEDTHSIMAPDTLAAVEVHVKRPVRAGR